MLNENVFIYNTNKTIILVIEFHGYSDLMIRMKQKIHTSHRGLTSNIICAAYLGKVVKWKNQNTINFVLSQRSELKE